MLEPLFNKVTVLNACNFVKKRLQYRCIPVNNAKLLRAPILLKRESKQVFSSEKCEIFKNSFFCRTPPVAASEGFYKGSLKLY